ncbi:DEAD/DEAH box helicase [Amylibacter ulvae]|uniref:DEAD/DEAH box helicase n=1 Tax=Paramylibacter ulvae TaxID=1651968 RepID=A0ABQ3D5Z7_9RHOB|nr:ATP-dependent helicase HrpB [Amylibacter ulvae]GHA60529.1 DEAD/DEAH box helicase [Amylibacter ulvae]
MNLPIESVLPALIDAVKLHNRAVLQAPPGAGKTTRVPLALLDAKLFDGKIIMLEPRRLAARAAAERLAEQLGETAGETVGYAMRGERKIGKSTQIEVVTEGVLTRMIQNDPELAGISCIIFDEFHERSLQADLGLALCLEIRAALRDDLCIIAMSATLDAGPVAALMDNAPMITSEGRAYPVEQRFLDKPWSRPNQRGPRFEQAMADLIIQAASETDGSILAFLPGEGEIRRVQALVEPTLKPTLDTRPLFGAMPFAEQRRAIAPSKRRKLVLATSIAETSLTIEDIRVVVDGGRARRAAFDAGSGMSRLITERVTKAEATQRQGRAGRVASGICYKLWTRGEDGGLQPFPLPEILSSDLSALVLELAAWGTVDPNDLPFLTQPRETDFQNAQGLLRQIGALDAQNRITDQGRRIAAMPTHPRLARMLLNSDKGGERIAALLESRDVLMAGAPSDFSLRIEAFQNPRTFEQNRPFRINRGALERVRVDTKRLRATGSRDLSAAQMAALAYPDRIGLHRAGDAPRFLLSGGSGAFVNDDDPMGAERLIVASDLDGKQKEARLRMGIAISESELRDVFGDDFETRNICTWSKRDRRVLAKSQTCFGALVLSEQNWRDCPDDRIATALLDGIRELGLQVLPWDQSARFVQARIEWLRARGSDLPDCSDDALLDDMENWLLPHMYGVKSIDGLKSLVMTTIIKSRLEFSQQQLLDNLAPAAIKAPTGTRLPVDYSADQPRIAVRLQELFGMTVHPTVGPDRLPLIIDLLSPARRVVQTTADLPNFWGTSYVDVRKDMRGRYPRHPWPEDPTVAEATKRVKPRGT